MKSIGFSLISRVFILRVAFLFLASPVFFGEASGEGLELTVNPYRDVDWEKSIHAKASFHTHTTTSDGSWNPHQVVDMYHEAGYRILAITDHDNYTDRTTWSWREFDQAEPSERARSALADGGLVRRLAGDLDYENRDPGELEMVAIQGSEITRRLDGLHCHVLSLFSDWHSSSEDIREQVEGVASRGGLAVLCHPAFSWTRETPLPADLPDERFQEYRNLFAENRSLVAVEVVNGAMPLEHRPHDRALWDRLLNELMPERPVWGLAVDDFHSRQFGVGWAVFPLAELDEASVRRAMEEGAFYFSSVNGGFPVEEGAAEGVPTIDSIIHDEERGRITLQASVGGTPVDDQDCVWIGADGKTIRSGLSIDYRAAPNIRNYVRAEISGPNGTTFTNPFGFEAP